MMANNMPTAMPMKTIIMYDRKLAIVARSSKCSPPPCGWFNKHVFIVLLLLINVICVSN